jgi:hypothetical protein
MKFPFKEGARVYALKVITEGGGDTLPDRGAKSLHSMGYVHAELGEFGTIVCLDYPQEIVNPETGEITEEYTVPTVKFDRTGTATIVGSDEIELADEKIS